MDAMPCVVIASKLKTLSRMIFEFTFCLSLTNETIENKSRIWYKDENKCKID